MASFKFTAEIRVAQFDPPGPVVIPCFWMDRVRVVEDCGAQPPSPGGSGAIVVGSYEAPFVLAYRWDDATGFGARLDDPAEPVLEVGPERILFHPTSEFVFIYAANVWHYYRWTNEYGFGEYMGTLSGGVGQDMAFSNDGTLIATGSSVTTLYAFAAGELLGPLQNNLPLGQNFPANSSSNGSVAFHPTKPIVYSGRGNTENWGVVGGNRFISGFDYDLTFGIINRADPENTVAGGDVGRIAVSADGSKVYIGGNPYGGDGYHAYGSFETGGGGSIWATGAGEYEPIDLQNIDSNPNSCVGIATGVAFDHAIWFFQHYDLGDDLFEGYLNSSIQTNSPSGSGPTWPQLGYYIGYTSSGYTGPPFPPPTARDGAVSPSGRALALASQTPSFWASKDPETDTTWVNGVPQSDPYDGENTVIYNTVAGPTYAYPYLHVFHHDLGTGAIGERYSLPGSWNTDLNGSTAVTCVCWSPMP
jgi:hypothetical protein